MSAGRSNNRGPRGGALRKPLRSKGRRHDPENPKLQKHRRVSPGRGYGNGALFQAAIPRRKCLSATHGSSNAPRARRAFLLLQPLLVHDPYIAYLIVLSGLYVFGLTLHKKIRVGKLPRYPEAIQRSEERRVGKECRSRW